MWKLVQKKTTENFCCAKHQGQKDLANHQQVCLYGGKWLKPPLFLVHKFDVVPPLVPVTETSLLLSAQTKTTKD